MLVNKKRIDNFRYDITSNIKKTDFDKVIMENNLQLRAWQKKVLSLTLNQNNRTVLWVFDSQGNSGKTELSSFLKYNHNFQKLPAGMFPFVLHIINKY